MADKRFTEQDVSELLRVKHRDEMYLEQVVLGMSGSRRIDALGMKLSWTRGGLIGYEIKVARNDFLSDAKWRDYLEYLNQFYFVTTPGVCQRDEIPEAAGWIETTTNAKRLLTKKKAPYMIRDVHTDVWRRIVMTLCGWNAPKKLTLADWERWLVDRDHKSEVGRRVGSYIYKMQRQVLAEERRKLDERQVKVIAVERSMKTMFEKELIDEHGHLTALGRRFYEIANGATINLTRYRVEGLRDHLNELLEAEQ